MNNLELFNQQGFLSNIEIFSADEMMYLKHALDESNRKYDFLNNEYRCKSHLLFDWVDFMVFHPNVVSLVKELLGEDIICIDTMFWAKKPNTQQYVSWHQDGYYWNIKPPIEGVVLWIPFQDVGIENGTLQYLIGSHKQDFLKHQDLSNDRNLLRRGQTVDIQNLNYEVHYCNLPLGSISLHHPCTIHGSHLNNSNDLRLACNIQFVSARSINISTDLPEYGVLVNGINNSTIGAFSRPTPDFEKNYNNWKTAWYNQRQNYLNNKGLVD